MNYAEARAELGIITQTDIDQSINLLRNRAGMPQLRLNQANGNQGIILEIRRERRIELYMDNFRWDDLMRWGEGQKLTQPFRGMYFPGAGEYDLEGDGDIDVVLYTGEAGDREEDIVYLQLGEDIVLDNNGLVIPQPGSSQDRTFDENRDYLYPLPRTELLLNENLTQNPGWGNQ